MGAVENLAATLDRFEELARLSDRLVAKFERTEGNPEKNGVDNLDSRLRVSESA